MLLRTSLAPPHKGRFAFCGVAFITDGTLAMGASATGHAPRLGSSSVPACGNSLCSAALCCADADRCLGGDLDELLPRLLAQKGGLKQVKNLLEAVPKARPSWETYHSLLGVGPVSF